MRREERPAGGSGSGKEKLADAVLPGPGHLHPEAWARLVENPEDRREALGAMAERAGGALHHSWLAFGDHDIIFIYEMPDNTQIASALMAAASSGALRSLKTTPLLTWEEGLEAMRGASDVAYRPPGGG